jgi:lipoprotein-anchoring transpeptidase ErfK/SrfK
MFSRRNGRLSIALAVLGIAYPTWATTTPSSHPPGRPAFHRPAPKPDLKLMRVQVILDHLGFSPGVIDGMAGSTLKLALSAFQTSKGLPVTGQLDPATVRMLAAYRTVGAVRSIRLLAEDLVGPFAGRLPPSAMDKARLPSLGYANPLEMLAERYHTTPATLIWLNSPATRMVAGSVIRVPDATTWTRNYPANLPETYRRTLAGLNVAAQQPRAATVIVSRAAKSLSVYGADKHLLAQFPVTTGSSHDPLPIGNWKIVGAAYNPRYYFNPKRFWDAKSDDKVVTLQPGPRGPVGIVWLSIDKPHYGIHGTAAPQNIGRTESHGCIRLTNWDAGRLSLMVRPGTMVVLRP